MYLKYKNGLNKWLISVAAIGLLFFGVPNIFNNQEKAAFNNVAKLDKAKALFDQIGEPDSITTSISNFYDRGDISHALLGKHHRDLWSAKVKLPVYWGLDTVEFLKSGGGQQTTSMEVKDSSGLHFSFRSIDKDNANILPQILKYSFLRPFLRDQASAINPYAAPVVSELMDQLDIMHPSPRIFIIPYSNKLDSVTINFAGQAVLLEEEIGKKWSNHIRFNTPKKILKTNTMLSQMRENKINVDVSSYIRCRLFDFLVSDWDRHERQWKWGIYNDKGQYIARPIPIDRDMSFCKYHDGMASKLVMIFNNKFQSYTDDRMSIDGLTRNSLPLDSELLKGVQQSVFTKEAVSIQNSLTEDKVRQAFELYPPEIFKLVGREHIDLLLKRMEYLDEAASDFYGLIEKE